MEIPKIYGKICDILSEVETISKSKKNQAQGFMFRGIDDMYNALHNLFAKHRVFIQSKVLDLNREERTTAKGGSMISTVLTVEFQFYAEDGSFISSVFKGEAQDSGDKSTTKAMSIALKYCLMQTFLIPTEDLAKSDPDNYTPPETQKAVQKQRLTDEVVIAISQKIKNHETNIITVLEYVRGFELSNNQKTTIEKSLLEILKLKTKDEVIKIADLWSFNKDVIQSIIDKLV